MIKKTKIICTVGPSTDKLETLAEMLKAGMNVARFNFSHGSHEDHAKRIALVRQASLETKIPVALMLDTKGPEMRLGKFKGGKAQLVAGNRFVLTGKTIEGTADMATVSHALLPEEVKSGDTILLSDGLISLHVDKIEDGNIVTTIQNSGEISDRKRVAAPGVSVQLPPLSEQDIADIHFGIQQGMDCIAASFIQRAADVLAIRRVLEEA
ncbi:MAG: pyruvate kinase, partial [Sporomusaceae bacterium]|nr:pyruvate kinase [Sporomusaceae bacterium]